MLTHEQILSFYDTVHESIQDLDAEASLKEDYSEYRYRVLNDGHEYSVVIPSQSFVRNASAQILREFDDGLTELELNKEEEGLYFLDGEMFIPKARPNSPSTSAYKSFSDILLTAESFDITAEPYESHALDAQQEQREKNALERLRHVKPQEKAAHFMAVFEYRLPDDSVYYVVFNKRGLQLARQSESFLPYPFYNRVGELSKVYSVESEKIHYDRSFRDLRDYL